jgi:signal transduction histidine kinase
MRYNALEPGLPQVLKFLTIFQVLGILLLRRPVGAAMGIDVPLGPWLLLTLSVPCLLMVLIWIPWWHKRLGRTYLPLIVITASITLVLGKFFTIGWLVEPAQQELQLLLLLVSSWFGMQVITLLVAWQYSWVWVLLVSLSLSIADGVLSLPFMTAGTMFYPLILVFFVGRTATITLVALGPQWLVTRYRKQREALAEANHKLAHYAATIEHLAASQERNRLARELHDTLAHSLSAVTVQLEAVQALWEVNPSEARQITGQALQVSQRGLTEARRALHSLRASPLEDLGLALAVSDLAKSAAARANVHLDLDVQNPLETLAPAIEQCIYRVAQESLTNVVRHADAQSLCVSLRRKSGGLTLTVADDGRGFNPGAVDGPHYGLQGLRERAEMVGANLQVTSKVQNGTTVRLVVPTAEESL